MVEEGKGAGGEVSRSEKSDGYLLICECIQYVYGSEYRVRAGALLAQSAAEGLGMRLGAFVAIHATYL